MSGEPVATPPAPWELCYTDEGVKYFYNTETSDSVWEIPADMPHGGAGMEPSAVVDTTLPGGPPSAWELFADDQGYPFYFNAQTVESKWAQPEDWTPLRTQDCYCCLLLFPVAC